LKPNQGRILIDGTDLWNKNISQTQVRRRIGLVFQFPETQLFEETVYDDVAFGPRNLGLTEDEINRRVIAAICDVHLNFEEFKNRSPMHLSEGEKRRIAIAGILAMQPEFLVLDEPTAGLDYCGVQAVINTLKNFHAHGKSVLLISHNLDLVGTLVDRIVLIADGKIHFDGHKRELFRSPEILEAMGLALPRIQNMVSALKRSGWIDLDQIYSMQDLKREITKTFQSKSNQNNSKRKGRKALKRQNLKP
ncbi:MAG: ATP-binding cassette domain-containing protein, partial [bacterium]